MKKKVTNVHFTLKEIMKHRIATFPSTFNYDHPCLKHVNCSMKTYECYKTCKNIEIKLCENLISSPHVCNGCQKKKYCRHVRYYYNAVEANNEYVNSWKKDRSKLRYTPLELDILNNDFKVLVLNCKSIYHALIVINKRGFNFKISTIYKQIERGQLALKKSDLPRCRKTKQKEVRDKSYKRDIDGHTYEDYNSYKEENPNAVETQMDTVEGIKENDAPVFFTIEIVDIKFILIFKLTSQNAKEVSNKLKLLKQILGNEIIEKIFEILLTDNGKEFIRLDDLQEILPNANIFYCHPYSSYEKGNIENNHELIRRVIPKGVSLKCYTQKDLDLLCSHINSINHPALKVQGLM